MQQLNVSQFPTNINVPCLPRKREVFSHWVFIDSNFGPEKKQHFGFDTFLHSCQTGMFFCIKWKKNPGLSCFFSPEATTLQFPKCR